MRRALDALAGITRRAISAGSLESPSIPLSGASVSDLWSDVSSDPMHIGVALRCTQIIAGSAAGCPLKVTNDDGQEIRPRVLTSPRATENNPGPWHTDYELWEMVFKALLLHGNAYLFKRRPRGTAAPRFVTGLEWIDPRRVAVDVDLDPIPGVPWVKRFRIDGGQWDFTTREILHFTSLLGDDGLTGLSVVGALRRGMRLSANADAAADRLFSDGLMIQGFLTTDKPLTDEQSSLIRKRWKAVHHHGAGSAGDVAVMSNGLKFQEMTLSPADAQFLETRKYQVSDIARTFGVPSWMVNDQEKSTSWGTGIEQQFQAFVMTTLKSYLHRVERRVTADLLPRGQSAEFKIEGLLRGDSASRAAFYASGIEHGWLVPNDVRSWENLPAVPWGDEPYLPFNQPADRGSDEGDDSRETAQDPEPTSRNNGEALARDIRRTHQHRRTQRLNGGRR